MRLLALTTVSMVAVGGAYLGVSPASVTKDNFQLKGEVYASGFKIEMKNQANKKLTSVKAGTYRIKIEDKATIHNFRLKGPGVNKATSVPGKTDDLIWRVTLRKGTYTFLCDPHATSMKGSFRVT
jgi:plastocyanin